jgi:hypothetical protein
VERRFLLHITSLTCTSCEVAWVKVEDYFTCAGWLGCLWCNILAFSRKMVKYMACIVACQPDAYNSLRFFFIIFQVHALPFKSASSYTYCLTYYRQLQNHKLQLFQTFQYLWRTNFKENCSIKYYSWSNRLNSRNILVSKSNSKEDDVLVLTNKKLEMFSLISSCSQRLIRSIFLVKVCLTYCKIIVFVVTSYGWQWFIFLSTRIFNQHF